MVVVQLLMGETPDRAVFREKGLRVALRPHFQLTQAVRVGDLALFNKVLQTNAAEFKRDASYALILRCGDNSSTARRARACDCGGLRGVPVLGLWPQGSVSVPRTFVGRRGSVDSHACAAFHVQAAQQRDQGGPAQDRCGLLQHLLRRHRDAAAAGQRR